MFNVVRILFVFSFFMVAVPASAMPWNESSHDIYLIDYNGDGTADDILLEGKKRSVEIPYDINVDLDSDYKSYVMKKNADGSYELIELSGHSGFDGSKTAADDLYELISQDLNGDGKPDFLVQSTNGSEPGFSLQAAGNDETPILTTYPTNASVSSPVQASSQVKSHSLLTDLAGSTSGKLSVSHIGAATYRMPLSLPSGLNEHQPNLALGYNSGAGNGPLGLGWYLSGISSIKRCSSSPLHGEDAFNGVTLTDTDRLCMSGQRLILVKGDSYWADDAEYKTETDSLVKVAKNGNTFDVITNGGGERHYVQITPETWALSYNTDAFGSRIDYEYRDDSSKSAALYPSVIRYGQAKVEFQYRSGRNDVPVRYVVGHERYLDKFLESVTVSLGGSKIRRYDLHYDYTDTSHLLALSEIQLCAYEENGTSSKCVLPLQIEVKEKPYSGAIKNFPLPSRFNPENTTRLQTMDWNRDGLADLIRTGTSGTIEVRYGAKAGQQPEYETLVGGGESRYMATPYISGDGERGIIYLTGTVTQEYHENIVEQGYTEEIVPAQLKSLGYSCQVSLECSSGWVNVDIVPGRPDYLCNGTVTTRKIYESTENPLDEFKRRWTRRQCDVSVPAGARSAIGTASGYYPAITEYHPAEYEQVPYDYKSFQYQWHKAARTTNGWNDSPIYNASGKLCLGDDFANTFDPQTDFYKPVIGDLDADGELDIYVAQPSCSNTDARDIEWARVVGGDGGYSFNQLKETDTSAFSYSGSPKTEILERKNGELFVHASGTSQKIVTQDGQPIPDKSTVVVDLNSDGLSDFVSFGKAGAGNNNQVSVYLNKDGAYANPQVLDYSSVPGLSGGLGDILDLSLTGNASLSERIRPIDYDSNGLQDLLVINGPSPQKSGYAGKLLLLRTVIGANHQPVFQVEDLGVSQAGVDNLYGKVSIFDAEGDGRADIIFADGSTYQVFGQSPTFGDKVTSFSTIYPNGSEIKYAVNYGRLNDEDVHDFTFQEEGDMRTFASPMSLVRSLELPVKDDVTDHVTFHYSNAKTHLKGRGFLGFESYSRESSLNNRKTTFYFEGADPSGGQGTFPEFPFIGRLTGQTVENTANGQIVSAMGQHWSSTTSSLSDRVKRPYISHIFSNTNDPEGSAILSTEITRALDNYGNLDTKATRKGSSSSNALTCVAGDTCSFSQVSYEKSEDYSFKPALPTFLNSKRVDVSIPALNIPGGSATNANEQSTYYTYTPHQGLPYVVGTATSSSGTGADDATKKVFHYSVGGAGKGRLESTSLQSGQGVAADSSIEPRTSTIDDYAFGLYPSRVTNEAGHVVAREFDYRSGQVKQVTTPNGLINNFQYDPLGRLSRKDTAEGYSQARKYQLCGRVQCPDYADGAVYKVTSTDNAGSKTEQYIDAFQRALAVTSTQFDGSSARVTTEYDEKGRVKKRSTPFHAGGNPAYTEYQYDDTKQKVIVTHPDQGTTTTYTTGNGSGQQTVTTSVLMQDDPSGASRVAGRTVKRTQITDVQGNVIRVSELADQGHPVVTRMAYDARSRLVWSQVSDSVSGTNSQTHITYDDLANTKVLNDPDTGITETLYNTAGEVVREVQKGLAQDSGADRVFSYSYDGLGRMVSRAENGTGKTSHWYYDVNSEGVPCGKGRLCGKTGPRFRETYQYGGQKGLLRSASTDLELGGALGNRHYEFSYKYDHIGRQKTVTYPSGFAIERDYQRGYLSQVSDASQGAAGETLWKAGAYSIYGSVRKASLGNGLLIGKEYDETGRLIKQSAGLNLSGSARVQSLSYGYDTMGNMVFRKDGIAGATESFSYDGMNRLAGQTLEHGGAQTASNYTYDDYSNIQSKGNVGQYRYGTYSNDDVCDDDGEHRSPGPHAVLEAAGSAYCYDEFGNQLAGSGRQLTYSSNNQPLTVVSNTATSSFRYGPDDARYYQRKTTSNGVEQTIYIAGGLFEETITSSGVTQTSYVGGFLINKERNGATERLYTLRDHLGSVNAVVDSDTSDSLTDSVIETMSYTPFGERRLDARSSTTVQPTTADRGFTDHEHLTEANLIHMNGRIYDPVLGRFLSADRFVQNPLTASSYNRYSYVMNNPLNAVDPSGYIGLDLSNQYIANTLNPDWIDNQIEWAENNAIAQANYIADTFDPVRSQSEVSKIGGRVDDWTDYQVASISGNSPLLAEAGADNIEEIEAIIGPMEYNQRLRNKANSISNAMADGADVVSDFAYDTATDWKTYLLGGLGGFLAKSSKKFSAFFGATNEAQKLLGHLRVGHTVPWDRMRKAQRRAFQHSYNRHAYELGLPRWKQGDAESLRHQFNNVVGHIRETGIHLGTRMKPFNGRLTRVNYYESNLQGTKYYYYETMSGQFISAGKAR